MFKKKLTKKQRVCCLIYCLKSHVSQFLGPKRATPLTNGAINQTLQQFAPLSDDRLLQLVDYREWSTLIDHLLKNIPNSIID